MKTATDNGNKLFNKIRKPEYGGGRSEFNIQKYKKNKFNLEVGNVLDVPKPYNKKYTVPILSEIGIIPV